MAETLINQTDSQGRKQGPWEETDKYGYIEKGHYKDDLRQGLWKWYYPDGTLYKEGHFLNGELHGLLKYYREDGTLEKEVHFLNGNPHGVRKSYHPDGTLESEGHYLNWALHGIWKSYHKDGTLKSCTLYNRNKKLFSSPLLFLPSWFDLI